MKLNQARLHECAPIEEFASTFANQRLVQRMFKTMRQENGLGLAATQVGHLRRVFVMEIHGRSWACWNPEILSHSDDLVEMDEGCLSFVGTTCKIKRPSQISVRYQLCNGVIREEEMSGLAARCFQHELDHLNGKTMFDRHKEQNEQ